MTTLATFYAAFKDLSVSGVTNLDEPPLTSMALSVRLPCKFVDISGLDEAGLTLKALGGSRTLRCRIVILMGIPGQDRHANRWSDTLTMVDTLNTALLAMTAPHQTKNMSWEMNATPDFDGSGYFAVTATVTAQEWT